MSESKKSVNLLSSEFTSDYLLNLTQKLLDSIANGDYETYKSLTCEQLTCFEPEAGSALIKGQKFHQFFFNLPKQTYINSNVSNINTNDCSNENKNSEGIPINNNIVTPVVTIANPFIRIIGSNNDCALLCYTRLIQTYNNKTNSINIQSCQETRIWEKINNKWKLIHFHRSKL